MKRIGIDYRFSIRSSRGIGKYTAEIVKELMLLDQYNEYVLYVDEQASIEVPSNFRIKVIAYPNILLFEQVYLPHQAKKDRLDVLWYPSNSGPLFLYHKIKLIVTVHDLIAFLNFNAVHKISLKSLKYRLGEYYRRYALKFGLKRIDKLLTVSNYSASQIESRFNCKAIVIPNNIAPYPSKRIDDSILERLNIKSGEYLFSMTGEASHKNLNGLIQMFSSLNISYKLVISGVNPAIGKNYNQELLKDVIFTGYISEEEKLSLYQNASLFIFLSLYEGFGIPLLEAMQFNIPIIASNNSSISEVLGKGGELVNPGDAELIRSKIIAILTKKNYMDNIKHYQQVQLDKYTSWRSSAEKLLYLMVN